MLLFAKQIMKNKNFEVQVYYTGFFTHTVEAKNADEAIIKARKLKLNSAELLNSLEDWEDADTAKEIK